MSGIARTSRAQGRMMARAILPFLAFQGLAAMNAEAAPKKPEAAVKKQPEAPAAANPEQDLAKERPAQLSHPIPSLSEPALGGQNSSITKISLNEAIERGLHQATGVLKARNDVDATGEQLIQSYAQFLPNLVATAGYNSAQGSTYLTSAVPTLVAGRNHGGYYQLSSTFNIFNGFSDVASLRASMARDHSNKLSLLRAKQQIALDIAQSFLQVVLDRDIVKIAEKNLASSQAREDQLTEQTRIGAKNMADLFRQQALTSSDETYLSTSQDKRRTDEIYLLRKLRMDPSTAYEFVEPTAELNQQRSNVKNGESSQKVKQAHLDNEAEMIRIALEKRADFQAQTETSKADRWDVWSARSNYFPKLDFGLTMAASGRQFDSQSINGVNVYDTVPTPPTLPSVNSQLANQVNYTVGLVLTWTIFDRWMTEANVERAVVKAKNSSLDVDDVHNLVVGEVRQAYGDYRAVLQQMESSQKGLTAAQKAYETVEGRYEVGSANFVDLTTAQAALVQAEAAYSQAEISLALQGRILETVMGTAVVE